MSNLAYRQAEMRARLKGLTAPQPVPKIERVGLPHVYMLPCPLHPTAIGPPSSSARCRECLRVYRRASYDKYGDSPQTRYGNVRGQARRRGIVFDLTLPMARDYQQTLRVSIQWSTLAHTCRP